MHQSVVCNIPYLKAKHRLQHQHSSSKAICQKICPNLLIILNVNYRHCFILMDTSSGGKLVNTSPEWSVWLEAENEKRPLDIVCVFIGFKKNSLPFYFVAGVQQNLLLWSHRCLQPAACNGGHPSLFVIQVNVDCKLASLLIA